MSPSTRPQPALAWQRDVPLLTEPLYLGGYVRGILVSALIMGGLLSLLAVVTDNMASIGAFWMLTGIGLLVLVVAGAGMLARGQNRQSVAWKSVAAIRLHPGRHAVSSRLVLIYRDAAGRETQRLPAVLSNGVLSARSESRLVRIVPSRGGLDYTSTDFNGRNEWTGHFTPASQRPSSGSPEGQGRGPLPTPTPAPEEELRNLALGRPASQSSTYVGTGVDQSASHAVDGKTGGRDPHDLSLTAYEFTPWWQVDLGSPARIEVIRIFNRLNPEVKANLEMHVAVSNDASDWRVVYKHDGSVWKVLEIPVSRSARYVRVMLTDHDSLQLYEVEVWGR